MAIVKMNKFTLLSFESKKEELIRRIQELSNIEFINLQDEERLEKYKELEGLFKDDIDSENAKYEENLSKAKFALEFLNKYFPKKSMIQTLREEKESLTFDEFEKKVENSKWIESYDRVKEKESELANLDSKIVKLEGEITYLNPWQDLDIPFQDLDHLKNTSYFLGTISKSYEDTLLEKLSHAYVEIISRNNNDINVLILCSKDEKENLLDILRSVGFSSFKTEQKEVPMKLIFQFKHEIEELQSKKFFVKEEIAHMEEELKDLQLAYDYFYNKVEQSRVSRNFMKTKNICTIQGWICTEDNDKLNTICHEVLGEDYYINYEDVKEDEIEEVPIKLKNGELVSAFESVTGMYSFPKYNEIDPTPLLAPFYLIFFGMMVADAGYGLIVLIASGLVLKFLNLDEGKRDFARFFFYLSFPTIFFGLIYGSFFGDFIALPTKLIDTNTDVNTILALSLIFGIIQIFFGLGVKAYSLVRMGKPKDAFYDAGSWLITLISIGGLVAVNFLKLSSAISTIFTCTMIFGMALIVLTGGRTEKSTGAKIGQGIYSLYGITGYVGDLVSYTRLMALGLAGGSIAGALNLLISSMPGIAAIVIGPVLFILAHIFNLGLSLLGAYVHTARLQYVEYFSKFYDGGGRPFKPFKVSQKYINIKRD